MRIHGIEVSVDVREELAQYNFHKAKWQHDRLIASSPFRYYGDNTPSFFVNLDESSEYYGAWKDSGAVDPNFSSGGFVSLLSFLRGEDYRSTVEYLLETYATEPGSANLDKLALDVSAFGIGSVRHSINSGILDMYKFRHAYFGKRGVSEKVQRLYNVGYDKRSRAVTLPWYNADGTLANVKYRKTDSKVFWYAKDAVPVSRLLFGLNVIYSRRYDTVAICEGESDVLSFAEAGIPTVGIGGSSFNSVKAELIMKSPIERLIIATDNDGVGRKIRNDIVRELSGRIGLAEIRWQDCHKDANDALVNDGSEELRTYFKQARGIGVSFNFNMK